MIGAILTHRGAGMRTNIEIDDELLAQVMKRSGVKTKREAVDASLRIALQLQKQGDAIRSLRGIGVWEGDLEQSRLVKQRKSA
jgi:Arc/MetJ family transcription regulator